MITMFDVEDFQDYTTIIPNVKKINKLLQKGKNTNIYSQIEELKDLLDDENLKVPITYIFSILAENNSDLFNLDLIEKIDIVPRKFFKKLEATDDIWEVRIQHGNNIFRLFGFFDGNNLVVLNHAFTKKTQKTPKKEIKVAEQRKKDYFSR